MAEKQTTPDPSESPVVPELPKTAWLTPAQAEQAKVWIEQHWSNQDCPYHGKTDWLIGPFMVGAPAYFPAGAERVDQTYPSVVLICQTCGHTAFVNAIVMQLVPPGTEEPPHLREQGELPAEAS